MSKQKVEDHFELKLPIPDGWRPDVFASIVEKVSTNKKKIKESDYLSEGRFPVIDQGQSQISGFSNNEECLIQVNESVVIFGDHTKIVKKIDTSFVPGADGIKVLKAKNDIDPQFLYWLTYYLSQLLPSKGYARHFQYIDNSSIAVPAVNIQRQIAKKIDNLFSEIDSGTQELQKSKQKLELYKQSVLNSAIQGKLVPQDPKDEPASKLLERIRAEKEKLIKEKKLKKEKPLPPIDQSEVPFDLPKGWELVRLGEIWNRLLSGYAFKSETYVHQSRNQLIRLGNVKPDRLLLDEKEIYLPDSVAKESADFEIMVGDILVTMTGTKGRRDYIFTCEVKELPSQRKLFLNQRVGAIRLSKLVNTSYVNFVLKSDAILQPIFDSSTGSVNQANIGVEALRNAIIPLPQ